MSTTEETVLGEVIVIEEIIVIGSQNDEHEIIVNGERHDVQSDTVSYEQLVELAFPTPPSSDARFTVTFRGAKEPREGSLKPDGAVEIHKHGAIFNVTATTKS